MKIKPNNNDEYKNAMKTLEAIGKLNGNKSVACIRFNLSLKYFNDFDKLIWKILSFLGLDFIKKKWFEVDLDQSKETWSRFRELINTSNIAEGKKTFNKAVDSYNKIVSKKREEEKLKKEEEKLEKEEEKLDNKISLLNQDGSVGKIKVSVEKIKVDDYNDSNFSSNVLDQILNGDDEQQPNQYSEREFKLNLDINTVRKEKDDRTHLFDMYTDFENSNFNDHNESNDKRGVNNNIMEFIKCLITLDKDNKKHNEFKEGSEDYKNYVSDESVQNSNKLNDRLLENAKEIVQSLMQPNSNLKDKQKYLDEHLNYPFSNLMHKSVEDAKKEINLIENGDLEDDIKVSIKDQVIKDAIVKLEGDHKRQRLVLENLVGLTIERYLKAKNTPDKSVDGKKNIEHFFMKMSEVEKPSLINYYDQLLLWIKDEEAFWCVMQNSILE